jgi:exopolysaccharide biosynthesis WecB/TagA/CpsF family protein
MSLPCVLDDYDLNGFLRVASEFGQDRFGYIVTPNVDHLIRFHDEAQFRNLYREAAYVLLDSRFLSYVFRFTKGLRIRVCAGSDLTEQLFARVIAPGDSIVLIGGSEEQAQKLKARYGLKGLAHYNPPMGFARNPQSFKQCLEFVEAHSPFRFCFLAVGSSQQELLAQQLKVRGIARGMTLCVGASINFLTGVERRAPVWMRNLGIEWLFRLLQDPRRLAKRYLVRGPRVFSLLPLTDILVRRWNASQERSATTQPITETGH